MRQLSLGAGAASAVVANHWAKGGAGATDLGNAVIAACAKSRAAGNPFKCVNVVKPVQSPAVCFIVFHSTGLGFLCRTPSYIYECLCACASIGLYPQPFGRFLYPLNISLKDKIATICRDMYGADGVEYTPQAEQRLQSYEASGYGHLPVCMAKTQYSLSTDPAQKGVPKGFTVTVRDAKCSVGAGFIVLICGDIMTIPGLPTRPGFYDVDMDLKNNRVLGLF